MATLQPRSRSPHIHRLSGGGIDARAEPFAWLLHLKTMSSDDRQTSASPVVTAEIAETAATLTATDLLAPVQTAPPAFAEPEMLATAFRHLQQRIPGFTQLSVQEKRSHARAANLDPEFIETGLHAGAAWHRTEPLVKRTGRDLRQEREDIRVWDETIVAVRAFVDGMEASNLKRKHHLGASILQIYRLLGIFLRRAGPDDAYMRPYYENMKRAYLKTQQFRRRKKKDQAPEEAAEESPAE
jgi:hypothetical protein